MKKKSAHELQTHKDVSPRATRKQTIKKPVRKGQYDGTPGPGRPKGSTLDPVWRLTKKQMEIANGMLEVETENGLFPTSIQELARQLGTDKSYVRNLLRREDFQKYLNHLLTENNIFLEMQFWRGMSLGLQVGDSKVLTLYARMTGKIAKAEQQKLQVEIISPDGSRIALPQYAAEDDIIDAEVIEDDDE